MHHSPRRALLPLLLLLGALASACGTEALSFRIGECVNVPAGEVIDDYESVPCEEAHDGEVFALPQHPAAEGEAFPGQATLDDLSAERCREEFAAYVGIPYEDSELYFTTLTPSEESWAEAGDRSIVCLLVGAPQDDGSFAQLTGAKEGSQE